MAGPPSQQTYRAGRGGSSRSVAPKRGRVIDHRRVAGYGTLKIDDDPAGVAACRPTAIRVGRT